MIARTAVAVAAVALAVPSSALAGGTWKTGSDAMHATVSWSTDDERPALQIVVTLTQPVDTATTGTGAACQPSMPDGDPNEVECPALNVNGAPAASGTIEVVTKAALGCSDTFKHKASFDGQLYTAQNDITSANSCGAGGGGGGGGGTSGGGDEAGAGMPVATPLFPLVVGTDAGGAPHVRSFNATTSAVLADFFAYAPSFTGGVRVAVGDVNADGYADIVTGTGPGAGPHVKVFDGHTGGLLQSFFAYDPSFAGGITVAAGDVNGDGDADVITGAGPGRGPLVKVFDGHTGAVLKSFLGYGATFTGGVRVAAGDVNGDGRADTVTGTGPGSGPQVKVFDGQTGAVLRSFFAYDASFTGGVFVAAGDVNGDGRADVVTGTGTSPHVKVFDGHSGAVLQSFFAYAPAFTGGVRVAVGDANGDGYGDVIAGAGPGASPTVKAFDGVDGHTLRSFLAFDPSFLGGTFVASTQAPGATVAASTIAIAASAAAAAPVSCPRTARGTCSGTVAIYLGTVSGRVKLRAAAAGKRLLLLGRARFTLTPGHHKRVRVHLSKRRFARLAGKRRKGAVVVRSRDAGANVRTTVIPVTLTPRPR